MVRREVGGFCREILCMHWVCMDMAYSRYHHIFIWITLSRHDNFTWNDPIVGISIGRVAVELRRAHGCKIPKQGNDAHYWC